MTLPLAGIVVRRFAALTAGLVLVAFAGMAAAGADTDDTEYATAEDTMYEVEVLDDVIEDDTDDADGNVASAPATSDEACTPMLVTHRTDGSSGDEQAVAITAQAQEFGIEGWGNVAWQAAEGAQLTALTITAMDGTVTTRISDLLSGSAIDVLELRFCGSYDGEVSVDAGPPPSEERDDTAVEDDSAADDEATSGGSARTANSGSTTTGSGSSNTNSSGSSGSGGSDTGGDDSTEAAGATEDGDEADDGDEATDEDDEPLGVVIVPTPENGNGDDADDAAATAVATEADSDESETAVLGVQLTKDSSPDPRGGLATALGLLLLALVAGGGAFLGVRYLRA